MCFAREETVDIDTHVETNSERKVNGFWIDFDHHNQQTDVMNDE